MSFKRSVVLLTAVSLGLAVFLGCLSWRSMPSPVDGAYGMLSVDEFRSDREIREALEGIVPGGGVLSESSQWVFLDDFGELVRIPLEQYGNRIEAFDPRNDGYAEKLRSFFVRGGQRRFFIPLFNIPRYGMRAFEEELAEVLGDLPYVLEYAAYGRPAAVYLVLFICAGIGALFLVRPLFPAAAFLPLLAGLGLRGGPGLACAAFLSGFLWILREPLEDFFVSLRYGSRFPARRLIRNLSASWRVRFVLGFLFLAIYGLVARVADIPPLPALLSPAGALGVFVFSLLAESYRGAAQNHIRFSPVLIMKTPLRGSAFPRIILPFALASLPALLVPFFYPGLLPRGDSLFGDQGDYLVTGDEYLSHAAFQASFSYRSLADPLGPPSYHSYELGEDGLLDPGKAPGPSYSGFQIQGFPEDQLPPFPLDELSRLLAAARPDSASYLPAGQGPSLGKLETAELVPVAAALVFSLPCIFGAGWGGKKKKKVLLLKEKRIAA